MVLELKVPEGAELADLQPLLPVFLTYLLSFLYLGIYWANHHHMLHATERVTGGVLWANLHLLLWLSLVPFATGWMGENHFAPVPTAAYGVVLLGAAVAYTILQQTILNAHGPDSKLARAVGHDVKGKLSMVAYLAAIPLAFVVGAIGQMAKAALAPGGHDLLGDRPGNRMIVGDAEDQALFSFEPTHQESPSYSLCRRCRPSESASRILVYACELNVEAAGALGDGRTAACHQFD